MNTNISLKNRLIMAYKGNSPCEFNTKYYIYDTKYKSIILEIVNLVNFSLDIIFLIIAFYIFFTLSTSFLINLIIVILLYLISPIILKLIFMFLFIFLPLQEISKEEYKDELKRIKDKKEFDKEKKKPFFQRYKEYKKEKGYD